MKEFLAKEVFLILFKDIGGRKKGCLFTNKQFLYVDNIYMYVCACVCCVCVCVYIFLTTVLCGMSCCVVSGLLEANHVKQSSGKSVAA